MYKTVKLFIDLNQTRIADMTVQEIHRFLKRKKSLSPDDAALLQNIRNCAVIDFSYTDEGGFDKQTGHYYPEEREVNYKIRIKYRIGTGERADYICLGARPSMVSESPEEGGI